MKDLNAFCDAVQNATCSDAAISKALKPGEHDKLRETLDERRPFHE